MKREELRRILSTFTTDDLPDLIPELAVWFERHGSINDSWIRPEVYRLFQEHGFHLVRNHFYGILPDTRHFKDEWWDAPAYAEAFSRLRKVDIEQEFSTVLRWSEDLKNVPAGQNAGFYWNNPMFPPLDAMILYGMIREHQPRVLLEVGSGFSTEVALMAARHTHTAVHCIEPYPTRRFLSHTSGEASLTQLRLQDVPIERFDELEEGDFLFIDTSHAVKPGSDVNHLIFNILPRLKAGVYVHVHDIFLPHEYPRRWYDDICIIWNEQYLLLAYLSGNPGIEVVLPVHALSRAREAELRERFAEFDIWNITENMGGARGASFWLRTTAKEPT